MCSIGEAGAELVLSSYGECRICQEEDQTDHLLSPCKCSGSIKYIHFDCLARCIESRDTVNCDICRTRFVGIVTQARKRTFLEFVQLNPALRSELIFAVVLTVLLQASLICQFLKVPNDICLWLHAAVQISFILFYSSYMYYHYSLWAPDNLKVMVIKPVTE